MYFISDPCLLMLMLLLQEIPNHEQMAPITTLLLACIPAADHERGVSICNCFFARLKSMGCRGSVESGGACWTRIVRCSRMVLDLL